MNSTSRPPHSLPDLLPVRLLRTDAALPLPRGEAAAPGARALFLRSFVVAITNPKALLFMSAFLPQFIALGAPLLPQYLALAAVLARSEEHTSELQSLMRISYAVFCLKKKTHQTQSH